MEENWPQTVQAPIAELILEILFVKTATEAQTSAGWGRTRRTVRNQMREILLFLIKK